MNIVLVLGCWGRIDDNFCSCSSVKNNILDLSKNSARNIQIIDYLDKVYHLFDRPLYNNIHTALFNIQDKFSDVVDKVFPENMFKRMEDFCLTHYKCGLYLRLELIE